jgi:4-amino-4-deoxy-L-arabinose transferase-like glycosyltransferase
MILAWLKTHRAAAFMAAAYLALAVTYGLVNPPFEATDEIRHFRYIRYLAIHGALPPVSVESSRDLQAHHPPLYYVTAALLTAAIPGQAGTDYAPPANPFWGFRYYEPSIDNKNQYVHSPEELGPFSSPTVAALFVARWLSTLFGLGLVLMAYRLGRLVCPDTPMIAVGALAFTAFNPTVLHSAASVNNDAAAAFFGAWAIVEAAAVAGRQADRWSAARFGLAMGLGLMTKVSVGALAGVAAVAWLVPLKGNGRGVVRDAAVVAGLVALITGWWFVRNFLASGDWMGLSEYRSAWQGAADRAQLAQEAIAELPYAWTTLWARLDYGQIVLPDAAYRIWAGVLVLAGFGLARAGRKLLRMELAVIAAAMALSLGGWAILMVTVPATAHARHILYVFPALGLLLAWGLYHLLQGSRWTAPVLAAGCLGFALYTLLGYLQPAFAYPAPVSKIPGTVTSAAANFEGAAEMLGFTYMPADLRPGAKVAVVVYWKPLAITATPLQVYIHLVDGAGIIAAQRDTYPGLGLAPTTGWRVGQVFADTYAVYIPDTAFAPETLTIRVGLWQTSERRPLVTGGSDGVTIGRLELRPNPGDLPNPIAINFNNTAQLIGYDLDRRVLKPGDTFKLQTYWRISRKLDSVYSAYVHLVGNDGRIWALADSDILPFTTLWDPGRVNGETRAIKISSDTPDGQYTLEYGLSAATDGGRQRLTILAPDGHGVGDHLALATMRVEH